MLKLSSRILKFTRAFNRQLSNTALKNPQYDTSNVVVTNFLNQINTNLSRLEIGTSHHSSKKEIRELPLIPKIIENPRDSLLHEIRDILRHERSAIIENPLNTPNGKDNEIQAARLIVIRRRKMKKHKLRKLRKKMKFEWAKVRQRREMRKEKRFQAGLLFRIKKAEAFLAEEYVSEKLRLANETPIPRLWKGKRLPQFIIKEKLGIK